MPIVVGVKFNPAGKTYFFLPNALSLNPGDEVIAATSRGREFASISEGQKTINKETFNLDLRPVVRLATEEDHRIHQDNLIKSKEALPICQAIINEHELGMNLISADYNFDRSQLLFIYTAKERVDFRNLLKHLAATFHTRIELRQIGDRDEPKLVGGIGICGRSLCCQQFLKEFSPISIKMAKEQNLSLNTAKISGFCGKLLCCLAYENEHYEEQNRLKREKAANTEATPSHEEALSSNASTKESKPASAKEENQIEIIEYQPTLPVPKKKANLKKVTKKPLQCVKKPRKPYHENKH